MEMLDIYDNNGNRTGKTIERSKARELVDGEHIAVGVIFIENSEGKYLMQKTSLEKGGLYSSTGGHITNGESPIISIKREVLEEIGIDINDDDIVDLGFISYDMPIRFMFYLKKDIDINNIKVQDEEVEYVVYMSVDEIKELIKNKLITESHGIIFNKILEYKEKLL